MIDAMQRLSRCSRMSAPVYFGCVALVTIFGVVLAMQLRPSFSHTVLELVGLEKEPQAKRDSFYALRVAPLFESRCTGCHGARMQKAQLRLDSFGGALRGGRHGAVIQPGNIKDSELFTRISLPSSDDRAMPPNGKTPLISDEVEVIKLWIAAGASGSQREIAGAPKLVAEVKIPEVDPKSVQRQRAALASAVMQLQGRLPGIIGYESRTSANLEVNASLAGVSFGDSELAALVPLQRRIVRADFSSTAITDASAPVLAAMTSLRTLRLTNTKVSDTTIWAITPLKTLRAVTAAGTGASEKSLEPLRRRGVVVYGDSNAQ
jgi:hypothetical protein